jgi:hypothetical protein
MMGSMFVVMAARYRCSKIAKEPRFTRDGDQSYGSFEEPPILLPPQRMELR